MEEFELPQLKDNEILAKVVSDSLCMSSYKAATQGTDHKKIPNDVAENPVIELADALLTFDGCLNFFAGPSDSAFSAKLNFHNVHYAFTHIVGTSGGNTDDIKESLELIYTHKEMSLTAISDFRKLGEKNLLFSDFADICDSHGGLWSVEAEELLLK